MKNYFQEIRQGLSEENHKEILGKIQEIEKEFDYLEFRLNRLTQDKNVLNNLLRKTTSDLNAQLEISRELTKQILEQNERFQTLIDYSSDLILVLDQNLRPSYVSENVTKLFGYTVEEYKNLHVEELVHSDDLSDLQEFFREILNKPAEKINFENRHKHKNGSFRYVSSSAINYLENPIINGILLNLRDITEKKKTEIELAENKERFQVIVESIPDGVAVHRDDKIIFINRSGANLFRAKGPDQIIGKSVGSLVHPNYRSLVQKRLQEAASYKGYILPSSEQKYVGLDGSVIDVEASTTVVMYERNIAYLTIARDITERKRMERLREDTERIIKHDLKNPLNGIIGFSRLLMQLEEKSNSEVAEFSNIIYNSAYKMLHLLDHSLDIFKMEEETFQPRYQNINFIKMLEELKGECTSLLEIKKLVLKSYMDNAHLHKEDEYIISGEELHLKSLFANLLKNAIEASPEERTVTIRINTANKEFHEIEIHNWGVIPESIRTTFFDRYSTMGKIGGTGLGTYSANLIAKTHGGKIIFTTSESDGTCLKVLLPKLIPSESN
ncbi:MAG: PAS domain-containing sensor histidine kinase [Spirochaetia bacterium]|nr:PAS domain-containing sensor histidine kinase [Spirochaetia bacterium]